ncbi:hypothetical protein D7030_07745 [Flavobacteriaceae bacterium AU392]|nr:hypothetical protein D1817_00670 [Flavobacteriaceae bacterium]RKM85015.1 hypothetical protein D7030_07745 [Flavobacteriaceae bacterium AU392]
MKSTILFLLGFLIFTGCSNDDDNSLESIPNGDFAGTFTVEYSNGDVFSNPVTVSFNSNNSYSSSNSMDYFPAGGSGTYEMTNSTIEFSDINFWTANFDWNLILNEEYSFTLNDNELIMSKIRNNVGIYRYVLIKQ